MAASKAGIDSAVKEIQAMGRKSVGIAGDVAKLDEMQNMVDGSVKALGPLNLMVANAGIARAKQLLDVTQDDFNTMFDVNVRGVFNCYQSAAKKMIDQGPGGKILGAARYAAQSDCFHQA